MAFNLRTGITKELQQENARESDKLKIKDEGHLNIVDLNNKVICITGTIPSKTRDQARADLKKRYPRVAFVDAITSDTDYLITGFGIGQTKLRKAMRMGIPLLESTIYFPSR